MKKLVHALLAVCALLLASPLWAADAPVALHSSNGILSIPGHAGDTLAPSLLPSITSGKLDPQAATVIQVTPQFCPPSQLNGTTPNDTCIQNAINYACAAINNQATNSGAIATNVGGELAFGRAQYYIQHGVNIPEACAGLRLVGMGSPATRIITDQNCTQPPIFFYPDAPQNYAADGGGVFNMQLFNNSPANGNFTGSTSCLKPLVQVNFGRVMRFDNLSAISPYQLFKFVGGYQLLSDNIVIDQALPGSPGVREYMGYGTTGSPYRQDLVGERSIQLFDAPAATGQLRATGIWWHGLSGSLQTHNTTMENAPTALKVDCTEPGIASNMQAQSISDCPGFGVLQDFEVEAGGGANVLDITDAQGIDFDYLYAVCLAKTNASTPDTSGCNSIMKVYNSTFHFTGQVSLRGGHMNGAQGPAIDYEGGQLFVGDGMQIYGNNNANLGTDSEITIEAPITGNTSGGHIVMGTSFCRGPSSSGPGINTDGLNAMYIYPGNDYITFADNALFGCGAGIYGSVGSHGVSTPNAGP